jgi:phosphatidylglycerophosphatase A
MNRIFDFLATGFYAGYMPKAPGTFGTLSGVLIFLFCASIPALYYPVLGLILFISIPLSTWMEKRLGKKDPQCVTIDEVAGFLVTMITFPSPLFRNHQSGQSGSIHAWIFLVSGFILFRFFDILKPWPVSKLQDLKGGWGVVLDDVAAGLYANLLLQILRLLIS